MASQPQAPSQKGPTTCEDFPLQVFPEADLAQALCPDFPPLVRAETWSAASFSEHRGLAAQWQARLINAALAPRDTSRKPNDFFAMWQEELIRKLAMQSESAYSHRNINLRFTLLFYITLNYHAGGPRYYSIGGTNEDEAEWTKEDLSFEQRLLTIEKELRGNKRVVMDVVEGTGVIPLVQAPELYGWYRIQEAAIQEWKFKTATPSSHPNRVDESPQARLKDQQRIKEQAQSMPG